MPRARTTLVDARRVRAPTALVLIVGVLGCRTSLSKGSDVPELEPAVADAASAVADAAAIAEVDASAPPSLDAGPPRIPGTFHQDVGPDERNLVLEAGGTFFWRIWGCDFGGGACGVWQRSGATTVLTPAPPATEMSWDDGVTFRRAVKRVVLTDHGADLEARVFAADGTAFAQTWRAGRICAPCGGGLGPSGRLHPCNDPLVKACH